MAPRLLYVHYLWTQNGDEILICHTSECATVAELSSQKMMMTGAPLVEYGAIATLKQDESSTRKLNRMRAPIVPIR